MTKGYLCTLTVLCTAVFSVTVHAETEPETGLNAALLAAEASIAQGSEVASERASRAVVERSVVQGWSVSLRPAAQPKVTIHSPEAVHEEKDRWTIVADAIEGDHLESPRAIGKEIVLSGPTGRLVDGGLVIEGAVVATRQTTVRAARAELTLPGTVQLTDVGAPFQRAE